LAIRQRWSAGHEVDVIYVVLPNSMHAEYTVRGAEAGKHVLSEKPMANTPGDGQAMIDTAKKAGKKLMVAYRCRYEPFNKEMIQMAREQELGPVKVIVADHGFNIGYGYAGQNKYRVIATRGWFELEPATSYTGLRIKIRRNNATEDRDMPQRDHFALEMDQMSDCVMENKDPLTPGEEGLRDLKLMMAIYEAARTGKTVKV